MVGIVCRQNRPLAHMSRKDFFLVRIGIGRRPEQTYNNEVYVNAADLYTINKNYFAIEF